MKFRLVLAGVLLGLAGEILYRRSEWHQIPTQIPGPAVYALVALDVIAAIWILLGGVDQNGKKFAH